MDFGEKLLALRKKEGMSQESLAEKLNTSRQAISKWENNQGFPETEKLLKISNIFNVSLDYLLKDSVEHKEESDSYYVSREVAQSFLENESKMCKNILIGIITMASAYIPYLLFKDSMPTYIIIISMMVAVGVAFFIKGAMLEDNYKVLKKQVLVFDEKVLKELCGKYNVIKKKYNTLTAVGGCFLAGGITIFLFVKNELVFQGNNLGYEILGVGLILVGIFLLGYFSSILEAYETLVKNDEYVNKISFKLMKKFQKKIDNI